MVAETDGSGAGRWGEPLPLLRPAFVAAVIIALDLVLVTLTLAG